MLVWDCKFCIKTNPWESDSRYVSQEILCHILNLSVHYRIHKLLSLVPILNQTDAHATETCLSQFHSITPFYPLVFLITSQILLLFIS
jgi:hypothetical protein